MSDSTTAIIKRITRPDAAIGIVKTVIVGVEVSLFPVQMSGDDGPHLPHIGRIGIIFEVPQQFVDVVQVHVVVVHLVVAVRVAADIAVAVHLRSPLLLRPCQVHRCILRRMRNRWRNIGHLTGGICVEMAAGAVVPSQHIGQISGTPASQRHSPSHGPMKPGLSVPYSIGSRHDGRA